MADFAHFEASTASEILSWAVATYDNSFAIASSLQKEGMVILDMASRIAPSRVRVFTLDTGRLPPETYEVMEEVRRRYQTDIETFFPERAAVEELEREKGFFSFRRSISARKECCAIRKLEPLSRALAGKSAWHSDSPAASGSSIV